MNVVFLSPHFPPNFYNFCVRLREAGANVLGLADAPYESLRPELKSALTEYYRVSDMHHYDELLRALGYFTHRYGKIDRLDSLSEYWLETEAALRTDFNIYGIRQDSISKIKRKSEMKKLFQQAGLRVARGRVCHTPEEARAFVKEVGYPVVAKPDVGVGAAKTYKIIDEWELQHYLSDKLPVEYILEEFIPGTIVTYDGLADREGRVVYASSMIYSKGVMETVLEDSDIYYYMPREIPRDLDEAGRRITEVFGVKERPFHYEFFRLEDGGAGGLRGQHASSGRPNRGYVQLRRGPGLLQDVGRDGGEGRNPRSPSPPSVLLRLCGSQVQPTLPLAPRSSAARVWPPDRASRGDQRHLRAGYRELWLHPAPPRASSAARGV